MGRASLGLRAKYIGATGTDDNGRRIREELARRGLDVTDLVIREGTNQFAVIMLSGSVIVETVFNWPGVGQLLIDAAHQRDFPLVQGVVLIIATLYVITNTTIDILYAYINPRIRYA